jgi:hypothetical protein
MKRFAADGIGWHGSNGNAADGRLGCGPVWVGGAVVEGPG